MAKWTKEKIAELKKKPYEELTAEERRIVNLNPIKTGEVRNPKGRGKGSVPWAVHFKRLMDDPKFFETIVASSPKEWKGIVDGVPAQVIAAAVIANTTRNVAKAISSNEPLSKDLQTQVKLLNDLGFGQKVVHETEDGFFDQVQFNFEVVPPRKRQDEE